MAVTVAGEGQCMDVGVGEGVHQPRVWFWEV
jgi:hypothetical protein